MQKCIKLINGDEVIASIENEDNEWLSVRNLAGSIRIRKEHILLIKDANPMEVLKAGNEYIEKITDLGK